MGKLEYRELFLFAAKAGALEGYLFKRRKAEPLANWINNISQMYHDLSPAMKSEVNPEFAIVLERILSHGKRLLEPALREKVEQMLAATRGSQSGSQSLPPG